MVGPSVANDVGAEASVGCERAVVAMAVGPGRGNQPREPLEQLAGGESEGGAAVGERAGEAVDEAVDEACIGGVTPDSTPSSSARST